METTQATRGSRSTRTQRVAAAVTTFAQAAVFAALILTAIFGPALLEVLL